MLQLSVAEAAGAHLFRGHNRAPLEARNVINSLSFRSRVSAWSPARNRGIATQPESVCVVHDPVSDRFTDDSCRVQQRVSSMPRS